VRVSHGRRWPRARRFFDILNTPIAAVVVLVVVVAVNLSLYFGAYSSKAPTPLPGSRTVPSATTTTIERTERAEPKERTRPEKTRPENTRPEKTRLATTPQSTTITKQSATVSATASATASATSSASP
jgi:hypothetical protein